MTATARALVLALVMALVLAPVTAGTSVRASSTPDDAAGAAVSLVARWPMLVDAPVRTTIASPGQRTLELPSRGVLLSELPAPDRAPAVAVLQAEPRPPDLTMLGRRQSDGG